MAELGIDPKFFKFNVTHLESERYVSVRDVDQNGAPQMTIVELYNKMNLVRRPGAKIEGSLMHLSENIVALRASEASRGCILQIFNMDQKAKLKHIEFSENIVFWKWLNNRVLGVVTPTSVYHVNLDQEKEIKIVDRCEELLASQVIGYVLSADDKWSALFGISTPDGGTTINGYVQLNFLEGARQQLL